jgi:hypothetical protein
MTINKSLGKVGVYFPKLVFSHGQLYDIKERAKNRGKPSIQSMGDIKERARNIAVSVAFCDIIICNHELEPVVLLYSSMY